MQMTVTEAFWELFPTARIESLLRSAQSGRLRSISPLVDLYNTVSLRHQLPWGGEDLQALVGDVALTRAKGGEPFREEPAVARWERAAQGFTTRN